MTAGRKLAQRLQVGVQVLRRQVKARQQDLVQVAVVAPERRALLLQRHDDVAAHHRDAVAAPLQAHAGPPVLPVHDRIVHRNHVAVVEQRDRRAGRAAGVPFRQRVPARRARHEVLDAVLDDIAGQHRQALEVLERLEPRWVEAAVIEALAVVRNMFIGVRQHSAQLRHLPVPHPIGFPPLALLEQRPKLRESPAVSLSTEPRAERTQQRFCTATGARSYSRFSNGLIALPLRTTVA